MKTRLGIVVGLVAFWILFLAMMTPAPLPLDIPEGPLDNGMSWAMLDNVYQAQEAIEESEVFNEVAKQWFYGEGRDPFREGVPKTLV